MIKFRLYLDKDKEEKWLNEMCDSGYKFKKFFVGFYKFNPCEKGKYIYRIDLIDGISKRKEYKNFMQEIGVEVIDTWGFWVFLRKEKSEGRFELYTDKESKIISYRKIRKTFAAVLVLEVICTLLQVPSMLLGFWLGFLGFGLILIMTISIARSLYSTNKKIKLLENNKFD